MEEKKGNAFFEWLKERGAGVLVWLLRTAIWRILVKILEKANSADIADKVRPYLRSLYAKLGPDAQAAITEAIKKLAAFAEDLLADEKVVY